MTSDSFRETDEEDGAAPPLARLPLLRGKHLRRQYGNCKQRGQRINKQSRGLTVAGVAAAVVVVRMQKRKIRGERQREKSSLTGEAKVSVTHSELRRWRKAQLAVTAFLVECVSAERRRLTPRRSRAVKSDGPVSASCPNSDC